LLVALPGAHGRVTGALPIRREARVLLKVDLAALIEGAADR
jgi:hypothetical protein